MNTNGCLRLALEGFRQRLLVAENEQFLSRIGSSAFRMTDVKHYRSEIYSLVNAGLIKNVPVGRRRDYVVSKRGRELLKEVENTADDELPTREMVFTVEENINALESIGVQMVEFIPADYDVTREQIVSLESVGLVEKTSDGPGVLDRYQYTDEMLSVFASIE
ncbi:hypothetical protein OB919_18790 [Halobacteria archaeon AArc-curdl1]|uniref:Uncharacterized protein n=1 Tax=Natronosalvus hydrolyticus TaxID=2979988 RepID=A0AAP3E8K6_9EURY|nr:hypothetical protein [Halobacteria archaeon AArc-curdl1]